MNREEIIKMVREVEAKARAAIAKATQGDAK